jgi:hypothetical protein
MVDHDHACLNADVWRQGRSENLGHEEFPHLSGEAAVAYLTRRPSLFEGIADSASEVILVERIRHGADDTLALAVPLAKAVGGVSKYFSEREGRPPPRRL